MEEHEKGILSNTTDVSLCVSVWLSIHQAATKMVQSSENKEDLEDVVTQDSSLSQTTNKSEDRK